MKKFLVIGDNHKAIYEAKDKIDAIHKFVKINRYKDLVCCNGKFLANKNGVCIEIIAKEI